MACVVFSQALNLCVLLYSTLVNVFRDDSTLWECMYQRTREMRWNKMKISPSYLANVDKIDILARVSSPGGKLPGASNEQNLDISARFSAKRLRCSLAPVN